MPRSRSRPTKRWSPPIPPTCRPGWRWATSTPSTASRPRAQAAFDRVVELDPDNAYKTFFNIATLLENKKNVTDAEQKRAIEAYRKAIEIKPDYAKARLALAYALLRTGDQVGAREQFEAFVELAPESGEAAQIRGLISALPQR